MNEKEIGNQIEGRNSSKFRDEGDNTGENSTGPYWEGELVLNEKHDGKTVEVKEKSSLVVTLKEGERGYWVLTGLSNAELHANAYTRTKGSFSDCQKERVIELSTAGRGQVIMEYVSEETHTKIDSFSVEFVPERMNRYTENIRE